MFSNIKKLSVMQKVLVTVILFDILIYIMKTKGYYFSLLMNTGNLALTVLSVVAAFIVAFQFKSKAIKYAAICVLILCLPILLFNFILNALLIDNSYSIVRYPSGPHKITIEYRNASLGETHHFYNFYKTTAIPGVSKKINTNLVNIMTRSYVGDDLTLLGTDDVRWSKGNNVITFNSSYATTIINLKKDKVYANLITD
ncbi:hypothetical protein O0Q50_22230 [Priestia aryabhattai]|uniref:Uncharacterized protein n=1 Tax=Priestia aryabhattai TaxID=412384 RepID=A0AAX6NDH0_PRIAR|nr:hypothetical protein [Priestia aryabhattai]MDU9693902.1 hypothetical protein [Priestia aryabhattai]